MRLLIRAVAVVGLCVASVAMAAPGGQVQMMSNAQGKVTTVPISGDRLVFRFSIGGKPAKVVAKNGGMIRIKRQGWPVVALIPMIRDSVVEMRVGIITTYASGDEGFRQIAMKTLDQDQVMQTDVGTGVIEGAWLETMPPVQTSGSTSTVQAAGETNQCCLKCGEVTVCGCQVELECGNCCATSCCIGQINGSPTASTPCCSTGTGINAAVPNARPARTPR